MTNLRAFNTSLRALTKTLPIEAVKVVQRKLALDILRGVVLKTPVDTGRARGNWQLTINESPGGEAESSDPIGEGAAKLGALPAFAIVYLTNNVSYIVYLENGSSKQAPAGMVALTLQEQTI